MKTMRSLFVGLLTLTLAVGALAAIEGPYQTTDFSAEFGPSECNWTTSLVIPKFDNSENGEFHGCYLTSVLLEFEGEVSGTVKFENRSAEAGDVTASLGALLRLRYPGTTTTIIEIDPEWTETEFVEAYDDTLDYAGASGRTFEGVVSETVSGEKLYNSCYMMNQFSGIGEMAFPALSIATSTASGPGQLTLEFDTDAEVRLKVTYTYYCPTCVVSGAMSGSAGEPVTFYSDSTPEEQILEYRWNFGDGSPVVITTDPEVTHTYAEDGEYNVTLCFTHRWANGGSQSCQADLCCELDGSVVRTQNVNWSQIKALYR